MASPFDMGERCIECCRSVEPGSGLFVNRVPADDGVVSGFLCADCQLEVCDRCGEPGLDLETVESEDQIERVCDNCLEQNHGAQT